VQPPQSALPQTVQRTAAGTSSSSLREEEPGDSRMALW